MQIRKLLGLFCLVLFSGAGAFAQDAETRVEREVRELREEMRREINGLKLQMAAKDAEIQKLKAQLQADNPEPAPILAASKPAKDGKVAAVAPETDAAQISEVAEKPEKAAAAPKAPDAIAYRGITIRPVGFIAFESVYRSRALSADLATPYNATPFEGAGMAHVSEWTPSARQSRFGLLMEKQAAGAHFRGYLETDFASAGTTSNNNLTNSYTLRIRQAFVQADWKNGWRVSAGQMFHLATENVRGTDPLAESLPLAVDINQHAGFSWGRQTGLRIGKKWGNAVSWAASVEQSETLFSASNAPSNFFLGAAGAAPGLYNPLANYSNNPAPDFLSKFTFDSGRAHYEAGGMLRVFRDRYYPNNDASLARNHYEVGGGFWVSGRVPVGNKLMLGAKALLGSGVGRYGASLLPDTTVRPDGTIRPIHGAQGFLQARYALSPRADLVAYGGVEYAGRTYSADPVTGVLVGYAPPTMNNTGCGTEATPTGNTGYLPGTGTNCVGATRAIQSGSLGYQHRFYEGPHGRLQYEFLYTYLTRTGWAGQGGAPHGTNNMVFTSFRYVLP